MKLKSLTILLVALAAISWVIYKTESILQSRVEAVFTETPTFICPIGTIESSACGYYSGNLHFYWIKRAEETNDQRYCGMVQEDYAYQRSACYQTIAQQKRDVNICQYATAHLGCEIQVAGQIQYEINNKLDLNDASVEKELAPVAEKIIDAFRDKNLSAIEPYVDPEKGISFGNMGDYGTKLMREDLASALTSAKTYPLRLFISDNPEQLTFKQFFDRYVWSQYTDKYASVRAEYYLAMVGRKNVNGTVFNVNPHAVVQFILPSKNNPEPIHNTFLELYFEKKEGKWYLIGTTQTDDNTRGMSDEGI